MRLRYVHATTSKEIVLTCVGFFVGNPVGFFVPFHPSSFHAGDLVGLCPSSRQSSLLVLEGVSEGESVGLNVGSCPSSAQPLFVSLSSCPSLVQPSCVHMGELVGVSVLREVRVHVSCQCSSILMRS